MLGSDLLSVRLGGIYGLCQLAQDYPKEFHLRVVNLLAAFVRHPPPNEPAATETAATEEPLFSVPAPRRGVFANKPVNIFPLTARHQTTDNDVYQRIPRN